jgi:hypothetical protein
MSSLGHIQETHAQAGNGKTTMTPKVEQLNASNSDSVSMRYEYIGHNATLRMKWNDK